MLDRSHAKLVLAAGASVAAWAIEAAAAPGPKGHSHATFAAGVPGDPKKPARTIEITATEDGPSMSFMPAKIVVEQGEQIRFVIKNAGKIDHEFMLDSFAGNKKHAIAMQKNPEMVHDDPNGTRIDVTKTEQLVWRFTKRGTFEYACLIVGHYESGMKGVVEVVAKGKLPKQPAR